MLLKLEPLVGISLKGSPEKGEREGGREKEKGEGRRVHTTIFVENKWEAK
jgi:hypothetical protein